jgi:RNA polymerase sigma factor (sigma-70 family)
MKDADILARMEKGDESALEYLYQKYYRMMIKLVTSNSGTEYEAKDIYQEALIVLWQKAVSGNLVLTSKLSTYLYSICQNLWRKELDRKSRLSSETQDSTEYMEHDRDERVKIIRDCIAQLGDTCQKVLTYYYFDGMSMNDIAEQLNFSSTDTAKTKKYKCKKRLDQLVKSMYKASDFLD